MHRRQAAPLLKVFSGRTVCGMVCINGLAEQLAIKTDASHADAAVVDPVITFDPPDELGLARQTLVAPVTARHLQSRINGLRPGISEKHLIKTIRGEFHYLMRQFEAEWMAVLESRRVIQRSHLLAYRFRNFLATVPQPACPQTRQTVKYFSTVHTGVVNALSAAEKSRLALELTVAGKWHPVSAQLRFAERLRGAGVGIFFKIVRHRRNIPEKAVIREPFSSRIPSISSHLGSL